MISFMVKRVLLVRRPATRYQNL